MGEEALLLSPEDEVFKEKCNCAMKVQPRRFMKATKLHFHGVYRAFYRGLCTGAFDPHWRCSLLAIQGVS